MPYLFHLDSLVTAFYSKEHKPHDGPLLAIDNVFESGNTIVGIGAPYSYLSLDLGPDYSQHLIDRVVAYLRLCCQARFHDIEVRIGNQRPDDDRGKL